MRATIEIRNIVPIVSRIGRSPRRRNRSGSSLCQPRRPVPCEPFEIVPHRMEAAFVRAHVDRLMHDVLGDPLEAGVLQLFLHEADVDIGHRPRRKAGLAGERSASAPARTAFRRSKSGRGHCARNPISTLASTGSGLPPSPLMQECSQSASASLSAASLTMLSSAIGALPSFQFHAGNRIDDPLDVFFR